MLDVVLWAWLDSQFVLRHVPMAAIDKQTAGEVLYVRCR